MQSEIPSASEDWPIAFATDGSHLALCVNFYLGNPGSISEPSRKIFDPLQVFLELFPRFEFLKAFLNEFQLT